MNRDDIIRMAREAGFKRHHNPDLYDCMVASDEAIERFAALVAAAEREACAELAFEMLVKVEGTDFDVPDAIRARGTNHG
jgi:hypothetical protein